MGNETDHLSV